MRFHLAALNGPQLSFNDMPNLLLPGGTLFDRALPLLVLVLALLVVRKQNATQWLSAQGLAVLVFVGIVMALGDVRAGSWNAVLLQHVTTAARNGNSTFAWNLLEHGWRG